MILSEVGMIVRHTKEHHVTQFQKYLFIIIAYLMKSDTNVQNAAKCKSFWRKASNNQRDKLLTDPIIIRAFHANADIT